MATVQAFKQAFPKTDKTVGLVLKTMNTNPASPEWQTFIKECQDDKRIYVLTDTLDRPEVLGLIDACDVYVSLHRAEGFGRTIAEAILLRKPVVVTNYSGNVDFSSRNNDLKVSFKLKDIEANQYSWCEQSKEFIWAEVNLKDAVKKIVKARRVDSKMSYLNSEIFSPKKISTIISYRLNMVKETEGLI